MDVTALPPSQLNAPDRIWPLTNCYVDVWIEILRFWGMDARPALAFTVLQDFEGDQFTFFKFPFADLERLYGAVVQELAIYQDLESHIACQVARGRIVLVEVDGFHLPDTRNVSYQIEHTKTTIGVSEIDRTNGQCRYFHNRGHYTLDGEDYAALLVGRRAGSPALFPYVEMVSRRGPTLTGAALDQTSIALLRAHLRNRPKVNPVAAFRHEFPSHFEALKVGGMSAFHAYTFNIFRQFGANHEMLADYLEWLDRDGEFGLGDLIDAARQTAETAKAMQFRLARLVSRKTFDPCAEGFDAMERHVDTLSRGLAARFG